MKQEITPVAQTITGDEKAIALVETYQQSPSGQGFHRYQIIYVIRDGKRAEFRRDMGHIDKWRGIKLLNIPSFGVHSVDELIAIADDARKECVVDPRELYQRNDIDINRLVET